MGDCCVKGFRWEAEPSGHESKLAGLNCYVTGSNADRAVLIVHDIFGWTFGNTRVLADHYAEEIGATVYVPDFFGGEVLPAEKILDESQWEDLNIPEFFARHSKTVRQPEIFACAKELRSQFKRTGAIGFCFGGWAIARLAAQGNDLVDCVSTAHPTYLEKDEISNVSVPIQIMAPEHDPMFSSEMKEFANRMIPTLGVAYDYQFFPGLEHGFATRGNPEKPNERQGMQRAKSAAVQWFRQWLY